MGFTFDEDSVLVKFVKSRSRLSDPDGPVRSTRITEDMWKWISDDLQKSVDECKRRWQWIEETYFGNTAIFGVQGAPPIGGQTIDPVILQGRDGLTDSEASSVTDGQIIGDGTADGVRAEPGPSTSAFVAGDERKSLSTDGGGRSARRKNNKRNGVAYFRKSTEKLLRKFLKQQLAKHSTTTATTLDREDINSQFFVFVASSIKQLAPYVRIQSKVNFAQTLVELELQNYKILELQNAAVVAAAAAAAAYRSEAGNDRHSSVGEETFVSPSRHASSSLEANLSASDYGEADNEDTRGFEPAPQQVYSPPSLRPYDDDDDDE